MDPLGSPKPYINPKPLRSDREPHAQRPRGLGAGHILVLRTSDHDLRDATCGV